MTRGLRTTKPQQTRRNYKNGRVRAQALPASPEPLNGATGGNAGLSFSSNLDGRSTRATETAIGQRIPVVGQNGKPLMPCKASKARRLLGGGKAVGVWDKLGVYYLRLTFDPKSEPNKGQKVALGLDPGSKFDGYAVTTKVVNLTAMAELPDGIAKKLEVRREMRRARRFRNCRRRPMRFDNRERGGFLAPSQKSKVEFRLRIAKELCKLYPVTDIAVEDVAFNHYRKRWGKQFSTVEIGKQMLYSELRDMANLQTFKGVQTKERRELLGLKKAGSKNARKPESHATDAIALASLAVPVCNAQISEFYVWTRYQNRRRQLHKLEAAPGGIRKREGGSVSIPPFKKNDVALWKGRLARVGGYMHGRMSLHEYTIDNKRFTQNAKPEDCKRLFNQRIMSERQFIPPLKSVGFLGAGW